MEDVSAVLVAGGIPWNHDRKSKESHGGHQWTRTMNRLGALYPRVVFVPGVDEISGPGFQAALDWMDWIAATHPNLSLLHRSTVIVDGVRISGCIGWPDPQGFSPETIAASRFDRLESNGEWIAKAHRDDRAFIEDIGLRSEVLLTHFPQHEAGLPLGCRAERRPAEAVEERGPDLEQSDVHVAVCGRGDGEPLYTMQGKVQLLRVGTGQEPVRFSIVPRIEVRG